MRVGSPQIRKLPIKAVSEKQRQELTKLVDKMLIMNKRLNEISKKRTDENAKIEEAIAKTDTEIDKIVYEVYAITDDEKEIIEKV